MPVSGTSVGVAFSHDLSFTWARVYTARRAPISELPRRSRRPNHGACEPGHHRVQPERDLGQFHGGGVEVHPVDLVQRDRRLDPLQFGRVLVRVDPLAEFGLAAAQVLLGELPDGLDGERAGPEGRLADRQAQDLLGGRGVPVLVEQLLKRLGHGEPGQHLGRVVRRRLLPLPAREPEDERAPLVQRPPCARR